MKKVWGADEVGRFFVTGTADAAGKRSHFYCRICFKDVSVLTHGPHEVLRHFQGVKHFTQDQWLRLETPGWRVLGFEGNPFTESELERRRETILRGLLVISDREYFFAEDLIVDDSGAPDAKLPVFAKVSSLAQVFRLCGSSELVQQPWSQFTLTASRVNIDVKWSRDEVLVGISCFMCLRIHVHWLIAAVFQSIILKGCTPASFLACLVERRRMDTSALNLRSPDQNFGCWCGHGISPHFDVFVWRCWADSAPIRLWRVPSWRRLLMLPVPIRLLCLRMGVHMFWQRLLEAIWEVGTVRSSSPAFEALPPANCCIRVWESGHILHDGVRGKSSEGCRDSGLDGVSSCIAQRHHHEWSLHAGPCWCGGKHCRGMATDCVVLEGDWPQRRRR